MVYEHQIPAHVFWHAFTESVREDLREPATWLDYSSDGLWTRRMFGKECKECKEHKENETKDEEVCYAGILGATLRRLKDAGWADVVRRFCDELYTVDAVFASTSSLNRTVRGWKAEGYKGRRFPVSVPVLIEHENQRLLETEFYKLLFWRSPLKVVIGYDFGKKVSSDMRAPFSEAIKQCRRQWPEHPDTEYLLIVGKRQSHDRITWNAWKHSADGDDWISLSQADVVRPADAGDTR